MDGVTAVVTGAGSDIGRALAHALAKRDSNLVLADVHTAALHEVSDSLDAQAIHTDGWSPMRSKRSRELRPNAPAPDPKGDAEPPGHGESVTDRD